MPDNDPEPENVSIAGETESPRQDPDWEFAVSDPASKLVRMRERGRRAFEVAFDHALGVQAGLSNDMSRGSEVARRLVAMKTSSPRLVGSISAL